jgi:two-component system response regulator protein BraR/BceR
MSKIMIIDDNECIRRELSEFLKSNGYDTIAPCAFSELNTTIIRTNPDLILLDINLAEENGYDLCQEIRKFSKIPIIFVTSRDSQEDELRGFLLGGDDFIRKPYHLPILLARIQRIFERHEESNKLQVNDVTLDVLSMTLYNKAGEIELSKNECRILYCLFTNKGKTVTKDELIEALWTCKLYIDENILNVNMSRLRKRLSDIGLKDFIKTISKEGYRV